MIESTALVDKFKYALENHWGYIWGAAGVEWTQAKQTQKVNYMKSNFGENWQKNVDAKSNNYYKTALYGSKWIGHMVADCSGLFAWAFKQLGGSIAHGSNSIYDRYCTTKGKITDAIRKSMLPGTAVFVDKSGDKTHIGLYVGNNTVIEAAGVEAGVCTSKLNTSKWTYYATLKGVSYPAQNEPEQPSAPANDKTPVDDFPTLKRGDKGSYVTLLQTKLLQKGYKLPKYGADGDFGSETLAAVKQFQKDNGLVCDGIVGEKSWGKLMENTQAVLYSVIVSHLTESQAKALAGMYDHAEIEIEKG